MPVYGPLRASQSYIRNILTLKNKSVKLYASEDVLGEFYKNLVDNNPNRRVHIPRSDVFYVRQAIYYDTGEWYTLDRVERAMFLEGMLDRNDVLDPDRKREWE